MTRTDTLRRKLLIRLRRRVKSTRRLAVELLEDGREKLTCKKCNHSWAHQPWKSPDGTVHRNVITDRLSRYRAANGGVTGECTKCTKALRDERYPLSKDSK